MQFDDVLGPILGPLDGAEIPGGCDDCEAIQTPSQIEPGIWKLTIYHDSDCPTLREHQ